MRIRVTDTAEQAGAYVAHEIAARLSDGSIRVLGVATGATPLPVYRELAERGVVSSGLELVALDEYVGLAATDPRSFAAYVGDRIALPLGVPAERTHVPRGDAVDPNLAAKEFEQTIARVGPVDFQILGLGTNGHVGFNEPGSSRWSSTRVVQLSARTLHDNSPYFADSTMPTYAITQGVATIMRARRLVVMATGKNKSAALAALAAGVFDPNVPATLLAEHPDLTIVADSAAAGALVPA